MRNFPNQIEVSDELSELFEFSEIYCTAGCCGLGAFEIHRGMLVRKIIDKGVDGISWYNKNRKEIDQLHDKVKDLPVGSDVEIPVIYPKNYSVPQFYLPKNELQHFFLRWQRVFRQTKGTQAVP